MDPDTPANADSPMQDFDHNSPEALFFQADKLIGEGSIPEATKVLVGLVEKYPDYGRAYNHLGYIYETKYRDYRQAEQYYQKCLSITKEYPAVYLNYAILLSSQERFDDLLMILNEALSCPGINKAKIYTEYGIMHEVRGEYDQAVDCYKRAIRHSFIEKDIETYKKHIQRVAEKKELGN